MNRFIAAGTLAAVTLTGYAATPDYPAKPITAVVPFPAGGSSDMVARVMGPSVSQKLGQPFVIDNRSGATGAIGAGIVKRAPADGYTLLIASIGVYAINPFLQKGLPYDPAKDVKTTLHGALVGALNESQNKQKMTDLGFEVVASSPEYFEKFLNEELARWKAVIVTGKITLE